MTEATKDWMFRTLYVMYVFAVGALFGVTYDRRPSIIPAILLMLVIAHGAMDIWMKHKEKRMRCPHCRP